MGKHPLSRAFVRERERLVSSPSTVSYENLTAHTVRSDGEPIDSTPSRVDLTRSRVDPRASRVDSTASRVGLIAARVDRTAARLDPNASRFALTASCVDSTPSGVDLTPSRVDLTASRVETRRRLFALMRVRALPTGHSFSPRVRALGENRPPLCRFCGPDAATAPWSRA